MNPKIAARLSGGCVALVAVIALIGLLRTLSSLSSLWESLGAQLIIQTMAPNVIYFLAVCFVAVAIFIQNRAIEAASFAVYAVYYIYVLGTNASATYDSSVQQSALVAQLAFALVAGVLLLIGALTSRKKKGDSQENSNPAALPLAIVACVCFVFAAMAEFVYMDDVQAAYSGIDASGMALYIVQLLLLAVASVVYGVGLKNARKEQPQAAHAPVASAPAPSKPKAASATVTDAQLVEFKRLLDAGVITQDEFDEQKRRWLNS